MMQTITVATLLSRTAIRSAVNAVVGIMLLTGSAQAATVTDARLGFSLTLADGPPAAVGFVGPAQTFTPFATKQGNALAKTAAAGPWTDGAASGLLALAELFDEVQGSYAFSQARETFVWTIENQSGKNVTLAFTGSYSPDLFAKTDDPEDAGEVVAGAAGFAIQAFVIRPFVDRLAPQGWTDIAKEVPLNGVFNTKGNFQFQVVVPDGATRLLEFDLETNAFAKVSHATALLTLPLAFEAMLLVRRHMRGGPGRLDRSLRIATALPGTAVAHPH